MSHDSSDCDCEERALESRAQFPSSHSGRAVPNEGRFFLAMGPSQQSSPDYISDRDNFEDGRRWHPIESPWDLLNVNSPPRPRRNGNSARGRTQPAVRGRTRSISNTANAEQQAQPATEEQQSESPSIPANAPRERERVDNAFNALRQLEEGYPADPQAQQDAMAWFEIPITHRAETAPLSLLLQPAQPEARQAPLDTQDPLLTQRVMARPPPQLAMLVNPVTTEGSRAPTVYGAVPVGLAQEGSGPQPLAAPVPNDRSGGYASQFVMSVLEHRRLPSPWRILPRPYPTSAPLPLGIQHTDPDSSHVAGAPAYLHPPITTSMSRMLDEEFRIPPGWFPSGGFCRGWEG